MEIGLTNEKSARERPFLSTANNGERQPMSGDERVEQGNRCYASDRRQILRCEAETEVSIRHCCCFLRLWKQLRFFFFTLKQIWFRWGRRRRDDDLCERFCFNCDLGVNSYEKTVMSLLSFFFIICRKIDDFRKYNTVYRLRSYPGGHTLLL